MTELAQLQVTGLFTYNGDYTNTWGWDSTHDWGTRNQAGTRALGGLQWLGGNLQTVGGVAAGTTCETGLGCLAAGYLVTTGYDNANAGFATMVSGTSAPTWGGQILQGLGLSPQSAELVYGASQMGMALAPAIKTSVSSILTSRGLNSGSADDLFGQNSAANLGGKPITFDGSFYSVDGLKISKSYYERLWNEGRPAPFLQAREVLTSNPRVVPDPYGSPGYFRYEGAGLEMIYNPQTGQIGHIQPIKTR